MQTGTCKNILEKYLADVRMMNLTSASKNNEKTDFDNTAKLDHKGHILMYQQRLMIKHDIWLYN